MILIYAVANHRSVRVLSFRLPGHSRQFNERRKREELVQLFRNFLAMDDLAAIQQYILNFIAKRQDDFAQEIPPRLEFLIVV